MKEAAGANKRFEVYITMSSPDNSGYVCKEFKDQSSRILQTS
jgi:hypothetical protein